MTLRSDLFDYVTTDGGISALISSRFYWLQFPEDVEYPAVRYLIASRERTAAHDGPTELNTVRVQMDVLAESGDDAEGVAEALKTALDGFKSGNLSGFMVNEIDDFEGADNLWRVTHEYLVHHVAN